MYDVTFEELVSTLGCVLLGFLSAYRSFLLSLTLALALALALSALFI